MTGPQRNSPFTAALLRHLPKPGLEVSVMLKEVAADVSRETRQNQRPQQLSDMTKTFYFAKLEQPAATRVDAPPAPRSWPRLADDRALDVAFWNSVQAANDCGAVRAYLQRFPQGTFVDLARLLERRLCVPEPKPEPKIAATDPSAPEAAVNPSAARSIACAARSAASSDLTRGIKLELVRLGCTTGDTDDELEQPDARRGAQVQPLRQGQARSRTADARDDGGAARPGEAGLPSRVRAGNAGAR